MMKEGASEKFDEMSIEGRDPIIQEDMLKYIRSNFEGLRLTRSFVFERLRGQYNYYLNRFKNNKYIFN